MFNVLNNIRLTKSTHAVKHSMGIVVTFFFLLFAKLISVFIYKSDLWFFYANFLADLFAQYNNGKTIVILIHHNFVSPRDSRVRFYFCGKKKNFSSGCLGDNDVLLLN